VNPEEQIVLNTTKINFQWHMDGTNFRACIFLDPFPSIRTKNQQELCRALLAIEKRREREGRCVVVEVVPATDSPGLSALTALYSL